MFGNLTSHLLTICIISFEQLGPEIKASEKKVSKNKTMSLDLSVRNTYLNYVNNLT